MERVAFFQRKFKEVINRNFISDFQLSVRGPYCLDVSDGHFKSRGARLFDISSLTKGLAYLVMLKLFALKLYSPETSFESILPEVPNVAGRKLWHFMSYVVQSYDFDFEALRDGKIGPFKKTLLTQGFGPWKKKFYYDNFASAYIGLALEEIFKTDIEEILHAELCDDQHEKDNLLFHPVRRGMLPASCIVPTKWEGRGIPGFVHDPLSLSHQDENIVAAGVFSRAPVIADIFHRMVDFFIETGFYHTMAENQLVKLGITGHDYGLGFDIPWKKNLEGLEVTRPLMFAGFTGCRIFFAERPRITVCLLTNRTLYRDTEDTRLDFSPFAWEIIREAIRQCK